MRKIVLGFCFYSFYCHADVGDVWPSQEEIEKAPETPTAVVVDFANCEKPDSRRFLEAMNSNVSIDSEKYRISNHGYMDLNQDGICEIIAFQPMYCGTGGCGHMAFQLYGDEFRYIGIAPSPSSVVFLEPHNGYLQFRGAGYSGKSYSYHYYRFDDEQYRRWRTDRFEEKWFPDTKTHKTFYDVTEYFEH